MFFILGLLFKDYWFIPLSKLLLILNSSWSVIFTLWIYTPLLLSSTSTRPNSLWHLAFVVAPFTSPLTDNGQNYILVFTNIGLETPCPRLALGKNTNYVWAEDIFKNYNKIIPIVLENEGSEKACTEETYKKSIAIKDTNLKTIMNYSVLITWTLKWTPQPGTHS